jgi:hypothetical protein
MALRKAISLISCMVLILLIICFISAPNTIAQEPVPAPRKLTPQPNSKVARPDRPEQRADWFMNGRQYPAASPRTRTLGRAETPAAKLREAFAENERVRSLRSVAQQPSWTEVGPRPQTGSSWGNVSGRVTSLALDPNDKTGNTVYVGTAFGGVWKCEKMLSTSPDCSPSGSFDSQVTLSIGRYSGD